jgi:hypothetical protein
MFMIWYRDACTLTSHNSGLIHQYKQYQIYLIFISDTCRNAPGYISGFFRVSARLAILPVSPYLVRRLDSG